MSAFSGAGLSLGTLSVAITAKIGEALQQLQKFGDETGKIIDEQKKKWDELANVGQQFNKVGLALTAGITLPLVGVAAASLKLAGEFEHSMNKVQAVTDATAGQMQLMHDVAIKLGKDTQFSAQQAADGMAMLGQAGLNTSQIIGAMPGTLNLAAAGELSIARAAEVTTNTLGQFGLAVTDAGHVADVFAKAAAASNVTVDDLAQSLKLVGPVAHDVGMSLDETTAALATLGNGGLKATEAGTGLRGVIASLEAPSKKAQKVLDELGITTQAVGGKMLPLDKIMKQLSDSGATTAQMFRIFGRESASAADILKNNSSSWQQMQADITAADGAAAKMAATLRAGIQGDLEQLRGSVETAAIALGEMLKPAFESIVQVGTVVVNWLIDAIKWFSELPTWVQSGALALATFAAAIGPVILAIGGLITAFTMIAPALGTMATAFGLASTGALVPFMGQIGLLITLLGVLAGALEQNKHEVGVALTDVTLKALEAQKKLFEQMSQTSSVLAPAYAKGLKQINEQIAALTHEQNNEWAAIEQANKATAERKKQLADAEAAAKSAVETGKTLSAQLNEHAALLNNVAGAHGKAGKAVKEHSDQLGHHTQVSELYYEIARRLTAEHKAYTGTLVDAAMGVKTLAQQTKDLAAALAPLGNDFGVITTAVTASADEMAKGAEAMKALGVGTEHAAAAIPTLANQLHMLGLKSAEEYDAIAADAKRSYDAILADGTATYTELLRAHLVVLEAEKQAWIAHGNAVTDAMKNEIAAVKAALGIIEGETTKHLKKTRTLWEEWGKQVQGIVSNLAGTIFKRLAEGDDTNAQLDKQAAELQKSLADRAATWATYQQTNAAAQQNASADYEADLAKEDAAYQKSLADKQADFDKYAADNAQKQAKLDADYQADLVKTTKDYGDAIAGRQQDYDAYVKDAVSKEAAKEQDLADKLASERKDLQDSLSKQTLEYERYVSDATASIEEIRRSHAESLAGQLADLDHSLQASRQEYADYVTDANRSLERIGADHAQNIADQTSATQDNIAAQTKDYKRYAADTQAQLARIRKKHGGVYSQEEADLQQSFDRRTQDYNDSVDDQNKKLNEFVAKEKTKQQQEEDDLKASLDRKARDQAAYEAEVQTKRAETVIQNVADQDQEIAAQQQALARKTEDFAAYQKDIDGKLAAAEVEYENGLAESRGALQQGLADKKTDLDQYNSDAALKYAEDVAALETKYGEDRGNLQQALADKIADLEQFNTDAKAKHDENTANALAAYQQTTQDLKTELGNQLANYGQFVSDTNAKLDEIRQAHKTLWGDIAGYGLSALTSIGEELVKLAASKALDKLAEAISGTAASAAGGAASGAGSAAGSAGGGIASAVGGLAGAVNLVSGAVSAVSNVISNFQQYGMNKSLDIIVKHTLQTANDLANLRRDEWDRWGGWMLIKDDILARLNFLVDNSSLSILKFDDMIARLNSLVDSASHATALLDRIAGAPDESGADSLMGRLVAAVETMSAGVLDMGAAQSRAVNMNLYGTDPSIVAGRIAQQMRLQGAFA